jgi:hypothetical protein
MRGNLGLFDRFSDQDFCRRTGAKSQFRKSTYNIMLTLIPPHLLTKVLVPTLLNCQYLEKEASYGQANNKSDTLATLHATESLLEGERQKACTL